MSYLKDHPTDEELKGYVMGTLGLREATIIKLHALNCEACFDALAAFHLGKLVLEEEARTGEAMHPSASEIEASAMGVATAEQDASIAWHCQNCAPCGRLFRDAVPAEG